MLRGVLAAAGVLPLAAAQSLPIGESRHSITHGLYTRSFIVHVPQSSPTGMVLQIHGLGSNDAEQCMYAHAEHGGRENGYVSVCPNGWSLSWNAGGCCPPGSVAGIDDVGFIREMLEYVHARISIPAGKVFTAGMSNGGMMSYRLACELSDMIYGAAPVTGAYFPGTYSCTPAHPRPVVHFHGTNDALVDYTGTIRDWRRYSTEVLGCTGPEREVHRGGGSHCTQYDNCPRASAPGTSTFCTYDGMGHVWPGGAGVPDYGLPATPTMWDFWQGSWPAKAVNASRPDRAGETAAIADKVADAMERHVRGGAAPLRTHPLLRRDEQNRIDISNIGMHIENITQPNLGIVGGSEVQSASDYPYMSCYLNNGRHSCGGALIHPQWVLTAAHCGSSASGRQFSFGSTRYTTGGGATLINVAQIYRHPSYNSNSLNYDGALARLSSSVSTSSTIQTVAMATSSAGHFTGDQSTVTGWGTTSSGGSAVQVLREVTYPIISNSECSSMYNGIHSSMLCSYTPGGGRDACQGDSGGPLVVRQGGAFLHVGIVSWGQGCAGNRAPGVYGRTSTMYSWICDTCGCC